MADDSGDMADGDASSDDALVGRNAQRVRTARGMTQADVATAMERRGLPFHQQTVLKVEKGQRPLRLVEAAALAKILDVPLADLVSKPGDLDRRMLVHTAVRNVKRARAEFRTAVREVMNALDDLRDELHEARQELGVEFPEAQSLADDDILKQELDLSLSMRRPWVPPSAQRDAEMRKRLIEGLSEELLSEELADDEHR